MSGSHRAFTPDEDAAIVARYTTEPFGAIAAYLGRSRDAIAMRTAVLRRAGRLDLSTRHYQPRWSEAELEYLHAWLGVRSDAAIAKHLGRPLWGVRLKARREGVTRKGNVYSARATAELFGVDAKTLLGWRGRGWIAGKRAGFRQGPYQVWSIDEDSLERFVRTQGWAYDWRRMPAGMYLTNVARDVARADPWLTIDAAARVSAVARSTMARWTREGLPHRYRPRATQHGPRQGYVMIRRADLEAWRAEHDAAAHRHRSESAKRRRAPEGRASVACHGDVLAALAEEAD